MTDLLTREIHPEQFNITPILTKGDKVSDRFEITGPLGVGGRARVFGALSRENGKDVAIKVPILDDKSAWDRRSTVERFIRESEFTATFSENAENTVPFIESGVAESAGQPYMYIATERMQGESLEKRRVANSAGAITVKEMVEIVTPAFSAASQLHENGLVHRDIKPHNIFIDSDNHGKLGDFGLVAPESFDPEELKAIKIEPSIFKEMLTDTYGLIGTAGFIPPEIDKRKRGYSPAGDVYAAGKTIHIALTGASRDSVTTSSTETHFTDESGELVFCTEGEKIEYIYRNAAPKIGKLIVECLDENPDERPKMSDVVDRLHEALLAA